MGGLGTFSQFSTVSAQAAIKIDKDAPLEKISLLGCGVCTGWGSAVNAAEVRAGDTVIVELTLVATQNGPLPTSAGVLPPSGIKTETPCCDVFRMIDGKVEVFNCYPEVIVTLAQLGVLNNLEAAAAR